MADIVKNPPKDETTPGQSIESRKTGDKKVVEELQDFNTKTAELGKDVKSGFRAIVEGIKEGNEELNPKEREKTLVKGFDELSDAQQNVVDIFGDMKASADQSQATMAKDMAVERITGLETGREQFSLWERMLLRLVGIDEDLDKLIANTMPVEVDGKRNWLGKFILGGILGLIAGLISGIAWGLLQFVGFYLLQVGKAMKWAGLKFVNAKFMKPIVDPIKGFFNRIGNRVKKLTATGGGWFTKNIKNPLHNIRANFLHGLFGQKKLSGVHGIRGMGSGAGSTANIWTRIGDLIFRIGEQAKAIWAPFKAFNDKTKSMWRTAKGTGTVAAEGSGIVVKTLSKFGTFWNFIKTIFLPFGQAFKGFFAIGLKFGIVLGRLSFWGTIILGAIDGIMGAVDKFKNTEGGMWRKILAGFYGFSQGVINGLIMIPLDLILFGVAWIIGLFGEPGQAIKKAMNSFSLEDIWMSLTNALWDGIWAVIDWFILLFTDPGAAMAQAVTGINNMMDKFMKWVLGMILPDPRGLEWYHPKSIVAGMLPDSLYEYAGLDPNTGQVPVDSGPMGPPAPEGYGEEGILDKASGWVTGLFKEDPLNLKPGEGLVPVAAGGAGGVVLNSGGNVHQEGAVTVNVVGGDQSGEETRWRIFSRFRE
jgi:hypothetical protein